MTDTTSLFRQLYAMDGKELQELKARAKDLATTKPLTEKQIATRLSLEKKVNELAEAIPKAITEKEQAVAKAKEDAAAAAVAKGEAAKALDEAKEKNKTALENLAAAKAAAAKAAQPQTADQTPQQRYLKFIQSRANLQTNLTWRRYLLERISEFDETKLRDVELTEVFSLIDGWDKVQKETDDSIAALAREGEVLAGFGAKDTSVKAAQTAWEELQQWKAKQESRIQKERTRRDAVEKNIADFVREQSKLLQWCRKEKAQLEGLTQTEHVQEFCGSLQANNATMEANFLVLSDMAENLLPNETVQKALMEVNEAWFNLQVYTYERLRQCLLDQHQRSKLEEELRSWAQYVAPIKDFLGDVERLLSQPTDEDTIAYLTPAVEATKALSNEFTPHQIICDHISDFSLRVQVLQDNYANLRRSVFSQLSILCQALSVKMNSWKRKEEYNERLSELMDWVDVKGHTETWKDLLNRVDRVKQLIDDNESTQGLDDTLRH
eukprot:PhF_6_TR26431/c0_g1_i1/m.38256